MNTGVQEMVIAPLSLHVMCPLQLVSETIFQKDHGSNQGLAWLLGLICIYWRM